MTNSSVSRARGGWTVVGVLVALALAVWWWRAGRSGAAEVVAPAPAPVAAAPSPVDAVRARRLDLPLVVSATGYLQPWRQVEVRSEASGRVVERAVEEGAWVPAGALLARLDDRDRQIELAEAEADWLKTQAGYAVDYEGAPAKEALAAGPEQLYQQGLISSQQLAEERRKEQSQQILGGGQQGAVRAAHSGLAQAEQRFARARLALERTRVVAPFAGRVADLTVELGQQINPGEPLLVLLEDDRMRVDVDVLEADIVRVGLGAPARVKVPSLDGLELLGQVATINPRIDPKTGTGRITVAVSNPGGRLRTGLFANVELETRRLEGALVVPEGALLARQSRDLVFRIDGDRALWAYVEVGARSGGLAEIRSGLAEGDLVATAGHFALAHEAPVTVREVPSSTAPATPLATPPGP